MKKDILNILEKLNNQIITDIKHGDEKTLKKIIAAYNRWSEDEHDSQNYIYNIESKRDLKWLVEYEEQTAANIHALFTDITTKHNYTPYVMANDQDEVKPIGTREDLDTLLIGAIDLITPCIIAYVARCQEYQDLYEEYITPIAEQLV